MQAGEGDIHAGALEPVYYGAGTAELDLLKLEVGVIPSIDLSSRPCPLRRLIYPASCAIIAQTNYESSGLNLTLGALF